MVFLCGPRGAGIRRLTGNRKLKATKWYFDQEFGVSLAVMLKSQVVGQSEPASRPSSFFVPWAFQQLWADPWAH